MALFISALSGLVFGLGLILAGMTDPLKVQAFLDVAGRWDPSLALVMGGAIAVAAPVFYALERRGRTLTGAALQLPAKSGITPRLLVGGVLFGIGWGLAGYCPGPALVALGEGRADMLWFLPALLAGMALGDRVAA
jgi:hypothetical protein